jgi:hypothetical protein
MDKKGKESVVHTYRLKKTYDQKPWDFENTRRPRHKINQTETDTLDGRVKEQSRSIAIADERAPQDVEPQAMQ